MTEERAMRFNAGKPDYSLIPPDALRALAWVYTIGALKYDRYDWLKGMPWSEVLASADRHLEAIKAGEDVDPDTGLPHAALLAWNGFCLTTYLLRGLGTDDRVKITDSKPLFNALDAMGRAGLVKFDGRVFDGPQVKINPPASAPDRLPAAVDLDALEQALKAPEVQVEARGG
jgi:hypothetical protein